jgi:sugar lactone lactonase YvrE
VRPTARRHRPRAIPGRVFWPLALALGWLAASAGVRAAQPQFWRIEGARDFLEGELDGLSVDSEGRVRLAPEARLLHDPESPHVWCLARDSKGSLYAGTGNEGRVYRMTEGRGTLFYDASELEVHALAVGPDGRLYAGSSPEGKVYAIDASGKAETFYDPPDKYIWALAFDDADRLYVATGAEGRVYRVDKDGKAQTVLSSSETHVTALASAGDVIYAGSSPGGILYRIDREARVFVLHDSSFREAKALDVGRDGSLYAALIEGQPKEDAARAASAATVVVPTVTASGGVDVPTIETTPTPAPGASAPSARATPEPASGPKGALVRVSPEGEVDTLWTSSEDTPHAVLALARGVLLATGDKGKLYEVRNDRSWTMLVSLAAEQVTALARGGDAQTFVATANPGRLHALGAVPGPSGTFTSKPKDTETVSSWGRLRWDVNLAPGTGIEIQTRSGNTGTPDSTWSAWSEVYTERGGSPITNERARFLQVRALLTGRDGVSPLLDSLTVPYLQRNLRPQVLSVNVHAPGEVFQKPLTVAGEVEILGLDPERPGEPRTGAAPSRTTLPLSTTYSRRLYQRGFQTFTWKAEDPNGDSLSYDIHYRPVSEARFRLLRQGLSDPVLAWDTSTVPNGRYVIRVTASDGPANPDAQTLAGDRESAPFDVDNTPPGVAVLLAERSPVRVRATVIDDSSLVRRAEYSIDGGRWEEVHPVDGINDAREESYEFQPRLAPPGPHIVIVRATDLLGNVATARIEVP